MTSHKPSLHDLAQIMCGGQQHPGKGLTYLRTYFTMLHGGGEQEKAAQRVRVGEGFKRHAHH